MAQSHAQDPTSSADDESSQATKLHVPVARSFSSETEDDDRDYEDQGDQANDEEEELARRAGFTRVVGSPDPPPIKLPAFSLHELRAAIPKHCFERSLATSMSYLAKDLFVVSTLLYIAYHFHNSDPSTLSQVAFWPVYWLIQGTYLTGVWILGHECGHHAFSTYGWINDLVGMVLHSALLTPYFSWKITHRHHHSKVNSMEHDAVFVPMTRTEYKTWREAIEDNLEDTPLFNLSRVIVIVVLGLMPGYFIFNATGPDKYKNTPNSHFNPNAVLFTDRERHLVVISDIGVGTAIAVLSLLTWTLSAATMAKLYVTPYVVMNAYVTIITLLQHTDTFIPRFRSTSWTWLHGALCTVDRDFGVFLNDALHHGPDTHVCHHIFSKIPFYHAVEATRALRPLLGRYYLKDDTPIAKAFWRCYTHCKYVEDDGSVVFCKKNTVGGLDVVVWNWLGVVLCFETISCVGLGVRLLPFVSCSRSSNQGSKRSKHTLGKHLSWMWMRLTGTSTVKTDTQRQPLCYWFASTAFSIKLGTQCDSNLSSSLYALKLVHFRGYISFALV